MPAQVSKFTFNGVPYKVDYATAIYGMTDRIDIEVDVPHMLILDGDDFTSFHSAMHEALEASGFPDAALHDKEGNPTTEDAAKFLWKTWIKPERSNAGKVKRGK